MLDDVIDRGTGAAARRAGVRVRRRRQDRHDQRLQGRLVRRLLVVARRRRVGRLRPAADDRPRGLRLALRAADLERLHAARRASRAGRASSTRRPACTDEPLCRISYLRPVEGCPTYTEYFKDGDQVPGRLCPIHQGTIKQRVRRAMEGLLSGLGKRIGADLPLAPLPRMPPIAEIRRQLVGAAAFAPPL